MAVKGKTLSALIALLITAVIAPNLASAERAFEKTRVGGFDVPAGTRIEGPTALSPRTHQGFDHAYDKIASSYVVAARGAGPGFQVAERVGAQLLDGRLGSLAGNISPTRLQQLASNPNALRFLDNATGNTNIVQLVEGRLLRITTAGDDVSKIISVGPIQRSGLFNGILNGRFDLLFP